MFIKLIFFNFLILLLSSCQESVRSVSEIKTSKVIRILTINSMATFYEDREGNRAGLAYSMTKEFAKDLGVEPEYMVVENAEEALDALKLGKADLVAAGLLVTDKRKKEFEFSIPYLSVERVLICHENRVVDDIKAIGSRSITISGESGAEDILVALKKKNDKLSWEKMENANAFQLFEMIQEKKTDCTISDTNHFSIYRNTFPSIRQALDLEKDLSVSWAMSKKNKELTKFANQWLKGKMKEGQIKVWLDEYYGHLSSFDPYDIQKFKERVDVLLPKYKAMFEEASTYIGWDWKLVAAIAYQESHWDPVATSPTGVRGLMMLTKTTAEAVGVSDREDPLQSLMGGTLYLKKIEQRLPPFVQGEDRYWMTLAAYNVGYAHLKDAWGLAVWREKNPFKWAHVKEVLPLLAKQQHYRYLPHGYARGHEPVVYVDRIRNYYDLLKIHLEKKELDKVEAKNDKGDPKGPP